MEELNISTNNTVSGERMSVRVRALTYEMALKNVELSFARSENAG